MFKSIKKRLNRSNSGNESSDPLPLRRAAPRVTRRRRPPPNVAELTAKVQALAAFDACIEAADAMAASGDGKLTESGIPNCSVLVSADGELLLVPQGQESQLFPSTLAKTSTNEEEEVEATNLDDQSCNNTQDQNGLSPVFSKLYDAGIYESAVFLGIDLHGDKSRNNFSARGWSIPATSLAIQQTSQSMEAMLGFCEQIILSKKEEAAKASLACDQWMASGQASAPIVHQGWEVVDPRANDFEMTPRRVGPSLSPESSLHQAMEALQQYYVQAGHDESARWRTASLSPDGLLPALHRASNELLSRANNRHQALEETSRKARIMEEYLARLKQDASSAWEAVYAAEDLVTQRVEYLMQQRSRERERQRIEQMRDENIDITTIASSEDIWNIVSAVTESMEEGSFEPMDLPVSPQSQITETEENIGEESDKESTTTADSNNAVHSRERVELEIGLPELRAAAMAADDAVEDAAGSLLNILSNLDTAQRSAKIAAETALLSACNAQLKCMRSLVVHERASLEARLNNLKNVETALSSVQVRKDLDSYINADKKDRGGSGHLGEDDDGGIASALAVLSAHVDDRTGTHPRADLSKNGSERNLQLSNEDSSFDQLDTALNKVFESNDLLRRVNVDSETGKKALAEFQDCVDLICRAAEESAAKRSAMCYSLNAKRSSDTEIRTSVQFEGICRIFSSLLTGCASEDGGVSNAKMCMMLAQTFYYESSGETSGPMLHASPTRQSRSHRIYVKSRLQDHPLWSKDDFWDEALRQQIADSLAHSGVMSNFERSRRAEGRRSRKSREWTQVEKIRWHDLNNIERIEAASQVQAVVFAQLGALAHSMIEFGCGLERSIAFVRRMAIRNQLPSSQRTMLLQHLIKRHKKESKEALRDKS